MTIHFSQAQERFIHSLIEKGRFASADDVIEEALRLLEESDRRNAEGRRRLEALLIEGLDSGPPTPMTATDWDEIKRKGQRLLDLRRIRNVQ